MNILQSQFEVAIDLNDHTYAAVLLNQALLAQMPDNTLYLAYSVILEDIKVAQEMVGYMPFTQGALRDAIQSALIKDCRLFGIM
jgi:hypothetical protein